MVAVVEVSLPKSWTELTQEQLRFLLSAMCAVNLSNKNIAYRSQEDYAAQTAAQVQTLCFFQWSGLSVICPYGSGYLVRSDEMEFKLSADVIASAIEHLSWTKELPSQPIRLDEVDGAKALPADISSGFSFDAWLACETFWQRYQSNPEDTLLRQMAAILYGKENINPGAPETLGVFYWWAGVKNMVSSMFPFFFKAVSGHDDAVTSITYDDMRRNIDAQIRALTKGDITKEHEILSLDAIRALTELDAQAREYDELQRRYPTKQ